MMELFDSQVIYYLVRGAATDSLKAKFASVAHESALSLDKIWQSTVREPVLDTTLLFP